MIFSYDLNDRLFLGKSFEKNLGGSRSQRIPGSISVRFMNLVEVRSCCGHIVCIRKFSMKNKLHIKILQRISFILGFGIT